MTHGRDSAPTDTAALQRKKIRSEVEDLLRQRRNGCVQAFQTQRCSWRRIRRRARVQEARLIDDVDNEKTPFQNFKHQPICLQSNCKSILHFPAKLSLFTVVVRLCMVDGFCARYCSALYYLRFMLIIVIVIVV
ncbi:Protein CROWDED NUCLEI [Trichinella spiralis]|uniref:Protein CROWDED NUCLEI n=1 Tax=Trichinella spiralis TaxID=6334 RepID=A0ABR3KTR8_TRISP